MNTATSRGRRALLVALAAASLLTSAGAGAAPGLGPVRLADWPTYGANTGHTFSAPTTLTKTSVQALAPAWFFRTGDAVTANPIEVGGVVYVGSWDGCFYAINAKTGSMKWSYGIDLDQPSISPQPSAGACPRTVLRSPSDVTTDGGYITSTAFFLKGNGSRPDLVIFGGGDTLYALDASNGAPYWKHQYPGTGAGTVPRSNDESRIFSSPVVVGDTVLFSVDSDGENHFRGYLVGARLEDGAPRWIRETDVAAADGPPLNDGCGNVWGSPTIVPLAQRTVEVVGLADCNFKDLPAYNERILAVDVEDGSIVWVFKPPRKDDNCDYDFGATVNYGHGPRGVPFLGIGGKDGSYYRLDPETGRRVWSTRVVFGGFAGGFIATTAYDGRRVYGATALGDFGRFEGFGSLGCTVEPRDPTAFRPEDRPIQEPSMHAFDATTGKVVWSGYLSQAFAPTTVAGGMTFVGTGITRQIQIRNDANGTLLKVIQLPFASDSGIVVAGEALFFGVGSSESGQPAGVVAMWPFGALRSP